MASIAVSVSEFPAASVTVRVMICEAEGQTVSVGFVEPLDQRYVNGAVPELMTGIIVKQEPSQRVAPVICALNAQAGKLTFWVMVEVHPAAFETLSVTGNVAGPVPG